MDALRMFLPITKVDATQRLVYGLATAETVDRSGEVCDYASTKPFYEKWSGDIAKATDGKSLGNLRAMHGKVAAGKVTAIAFNDAAKQIEIAAKVVDDAEWRKVEEGVYTGFSQGGGYVKRWKDDAGLQRYTADPSEVSLVDLPCLESATFQMVKAAGVEEKRQFAEKVRVAEPSNDAVVKKAGELAKAAGREAEWAEFVVTARDELKKAALPAPPEMAPTSGEPTPPAPSDDLQQGWMAKDGSFHLKKADAAAKNAEIEATAGAKGVLDKIDDISGRLGIEKAGDWSVTSKNKGKTTHASKDAAVAESKARDGNGDTDIVCSGKDGKAAAWKAAPAGELDKRGARNNAADQSTIQAMHDHACNLGATCSADNCAEADDGAGKGLKHGDLAKALGAMTEERDLAKARGDALQKTLDERIMPALDTILKRVENIEKQPVTLPFSGALAGLGLRSVSKGGDLDVEAAQGELTRLQKEDPEAFRMLVHKIALSNPQQMIPRT